MSYIADEAMRARAIARSLQAPPATFADIARANPSGLAGRLTRTLTRASRATAEAEGRRWLKAVHVGDKR